MPDRTDGASLRSGFLRHAASSPDAPAIVARGETRSYGEMDANARRWAGAIMDAVGRRPERVGLFAFRSETAYTGTLAALFAGAAFVPLNPTFPPEKTAAMIALADLDALIVDRGCLRQLAALPVELSGICIVVPELPASEIPDVGATVLDRDALQAAAPLVRLEPLTPEDTAYLLFTSGSTGAPKGVPVAHGNAVYFMEVMSRRYDIQPADRFSQTFDQTFDLSVFDLFMAWSNGACVYAMSPVDLLSPTRFIHQNGITVWFSVPSVPAQMLRRNTLAAGSMPSLRLSLFCGEPLPQRSAEAWQQAAPGSALENLYGPTELTIACFVHRWDAATSPALCRNGVVPIGRPYEGLMAMIVDEQLTPVADGEIGELCVAGPQTTPGYWKAPEITAQRFVALPVSRHETRRFYRTGDLVARLPGGDYVFMGRADQQIKVLGHRVELGEIEAALRLGARVEHAVAFGIPLGSTSADSVVAFVSGDLPDADALRALARTTLPPYIVPRHIHVVDEMPFNANGKVDRRALQERLAPDGGCAPTLAAVAS
jgi:amino acid adenylation domain-containing protein